MRHALAVLAAALAVVAVAACQTQNQYDGVSRFAGSGETYVPYHGAGSLPRESGPETGEG